MNNRSLKIACVGEAMIELSLSTNSKEAKVGFAGDTLNTAIYMRRALPSEHTVAFVSVIGVDSLSDQMAEFIESEGVSTAALLRNPDKLPGVYAISTDEEGERSFQYWRENSAARTLFQTEDGYDFDFLGEFDLVYFSAITLAILPKAVREALFEWIKGYRAKGGLISFDSNYRPRLWKDQAEAQEAVAAAWRVTDIALPSVDDEMDLFGDVDEDAVVNRFKSYGVRDGVLKRGEAGPLPLCAVRDPSLEFPAVENVIDTTAAGDSFVGTFLANYLVNNDLSAAMLAGHECASRVIQHRGAIIPRD